MKTKQFRNISLGLLSLLLLGSCSQRLQENPLSPDEKAINVRFTAQLQGTQNNAAGTDEQLNATEIKGYHFSEEGILLEVLTGEDRTQNGTVAFYPTSTTGTIYFVANDTKNIFGQLQTGSTTADSFLKTVAAASSLAAEQVLMTGSMTLGGQTTTVSNISLRRAVARLDLVVPDSGVLLHQVTIQGIANQGFVFPQASIASPEGTQWESFQKEFPEPGIGNYSETLMYLNEQAGTPLSAEIIASYGGGMHRMVAQFPTQIERNNIYTLRVKGSGTGVSASITGDDWDEGSSSDATLNINGLVDVEASTLPAGVIVSPTRDSVYIPYTGTEMQLALRAEEGSQVQIDGTVDRATATLNTSTKAITSIATVTVNSTRRMPNEAQEYIFLNTYQDNKHAGRVVLVFQPNPVQITGAINLDNNGNHDFGQYVDGELGRITLPEGKVAAAEFDSGEDPWVKIAADSLNPQSLRILGGWRPNDPTANGRVQSCRLVFTNTDGSDREVYTISRKNWGLPVVKFAGNWWCKYNLRGNAQSFEDQISIQDDQTRTGSLAAYLSTCDTATLRKLIGDQYQGGYPDGLKLKHDGSHFYFEDYRSSAQGFSATMAPAGYQIPNKATLSAFGGSENFNLGGIGTGLHTITNMLGQQVAVRVVERSNTHIAGGLYGTIDFYAFSTQPNDTCVLFGPGHQWGSTRGNFSPMMILFATSNASGSSWYMEGYAQSTKANQNWWKFTANNNNKTRTIRCIKVPVEYIY